MKEDELEVKIKKEIKNKYQELKNKSKTFGDLSKEINLFCKDEIFSNRELGQVIMLEMLEMLKKDTGNISI